MQEAMLDFAIADQNMANLLQQLRNWIKNTNLAMRFMVGFAAIRSVRAGCVRLSILSYASLCFGEMG